MNKNSEPKKEAEPKKEQTKENLHLHFNRHSPYKNYEQSKFPTTLLINEY